MLVSALLGCGRQDHLRAQSGSGVVLRRALGGEPASLDPGKAEDTYSFEVIRDLFEGLVSESASGEVQPGMASSWTVSASGTEYVFRLRQDAKWSNGEAIRAQDFVESWRRVVDPREASPVSDLLRPIEHAAEIISGKLPPADLSVFAPDSTHLVVRLVQPSPYFLQLLTHSATYPIYQNETPGHGDRKWVSNGPYVLASWTPGASLLLKKSPNYWDQRHVRIEDIEYIPISDDHAELDRYRDGQLDITQSVPPNSIDLINIEFPKDLHVAPYLGTVYYSMNMRPNRPLKNLLLRRALTMSVDREALAKAVLAFGQTPAYGFVPPGTWNYDSQSSSWKSMSRAERLRQAQLLYAEAGYSSTNPLRLKLLFNSSPEIKKLTVAIATMWTVNLGIEIDLTDEEYRVFLNSRKDPSRWDVARLSWVADYNDAANFLDMFRRSSPNNDSGYSVTRVDALLDEAASTANASARKLLLEQAENFVLSDCPVIPVYFYSSKRLIKPYVEGAQSNPLNRLYSKHLSLLPH